MILTLHSRAWVRTCNRLRGLETTSGFLLPKQIKGSAESDGFFTTPEADWSSRTQITFSLPTKRFQVSKTPNPLQFYGFTVGPIQISRVFICIKRSETGAPDSLTCYFAEIIREPDQWPAHKQSNFRTAGLCREGDLWSYIPAISALTVPKYECRFMRWGSKMR